VRALTRVASDATEDYFLSIALQGTADHVEKLVRGFRRAKDAEELSREAEQQANRELRYYHENGSLVLKGRLPAEIGALVVKALQSALLFRAGFDVWTFAEGAGAVPASHSGRKSDMSIPARRFTRHGGSRAARRFTRDRGRAWHAGGGGRRAGSVDARELHRFREGRSQAEGSSRLRSGCR
jgi:hypothetical protein